MPSPQFRWLRPVRPWALWLLIIVGTSPASGQTPAQDGQWSAPFDLPLIAIHAAMLPTGKVLLFSAEHGVPGIHGWLLDPTSLALTNVPPPAGATGLAMGAALLGMLRFVSCASGKRRPLVRSRS